MTCSIYKGKEENYTVYTPPNKSAELWWILEYWPTNIWHKNALPYFILWVNLLYVINVNFMCVKVAGGRRENVWLTVRIINQKMHFQVVTVISFLLLLHFCVKLFKKIFVWIYWTQKRKKKKFNWILCLFILRVCTLYTMLLCLCDNNKWA